MRGTKIVLDLEFISSRQLHQPFAMHEIIEIGAVALNTENEIMNEFQIYVKPQYGTVSPTITSITGITNDMLVKASYFSDAMQAFEAWLPRKEAYRFYTWSQNDQTVFLRESEWKERPLLDGFYKYWVDLQRLHQRIYHFSRPLKLVEALGSMQIEFEGTEHGALADARNTAKILQVLSNVRGVQEIRSHSHVTYNDNRHTAGFTLGLQIRKSSHSRR